jgi:transcriptional regulator with XRE-family HTH domain
MERASGEQSPFGALLKRYRLAAGLTHEALAERAALGVRTISDLERGVSSRASR